jgi:ATP-dependent Clp protease ATP-binding subunit ClpC
LPSRFLPDKAIDIMDEAGSKARIAAMTRPPELKGIEVRSKPSASRKKKPSVSKISKKPPHFATRKNRPRNVSTPCSKPGAMPARRRPWMSMTKTSWASSPNGPASPSSAWNRPRPTSSSRWRAELKSRIIGQDEAVIAISKALRRSRADLKDPRRPIGSFLFLGPTGVGKTFLAKNLAEFMFGSADALIQIDMSEYMEKHTASRLIGAPPGYVGYEEGGQLSEAVRRRPYSVVLFDEVEKAHPDVMHLLLQILEEGQVTDNFGRKIDFRNTIVILTSNVGAETIKRQTSLGFGAMSQDTSDHEGIKGKIGEQAKKFFKPEFLNRLDDIVVFRMLEKEQLVTIVDLEVGKVVTRLKNKKIELVLDQVAREFLMKEGYDPQYGARPMRRAVEKHIEDPSPSTSCAETSARATASKSPSMTRRKASNSSPTPARKWSNPPPPNPPPTPLKPLVAS